MKEENPKAWWREVKRLSGAHTNSEALWNHIHTEGAEELSPQDWRTLSMRRSLERMEEYCLPLPLAQIPLKEHSAHLPVLSELRIARLLAKLNPSQACGVVDQMKFPIGYCSSIPNFLLTLYVV